MIELAWGVLYPDGLVDDDLDPDDAQWLAGRHRARAVVVREAGGSWRGPTRDELHRARGGQEAGQ